MARYEELRLEVEPMDEPHCRKYEQLVSYFDKDFSRVDTQSREDHNNYFVEG
jgi:hypothetical protein